MLCCDNNSEGFAFAAHKLWEYSNSYVTQNKVNSRNKSFKNP